jgi:hypothetical protein
MTKTKRMKVETRARVGLLVVRGVESRSKILIGLVFQGVTWLEIYSVEPPKPVLPQVHSHLDPHRLDEVSSLGVGIL